MFELVELKESAEMLDIDLSHVILYGHGLLKGIQTGSILGVLSGSLLFLKRSKLPLFSYVKRYARGGQIVCGSLVPLSIYFKMKDKENIEWQDRAWRLVNNNNQNGVDNACIVGALLGSALVGSAGVGISLAVPFAAIYNNFMVQQKTIINNNIKN
jgi:hypothetical protein